VKIAESCGCYGEAVENPSHVEDALQRALKSNLNGTSAILDFRVDAKSITEGFSEYYEEG
jgi:thiamine pyrophosphate-dependent acetolactate synthase large subunit-like protein